MMIARLTCVVLHCHHNRTLIACNCFSAINQMFTATSHILMMQGQAAPKTSPTGSLAEFAGVYPGPGLKQCTDTGLTSCHFYLIWKEASAQVSITLIPEDADTESVYALIRHLQSEPMN